MTGTQLHLLRHFQVHSDPVIHRGMKDVLKHKFRESRPRTDIRSGRPRWQDCRAQSSRLSFWNNFGTVIKCLLSVHTAELLCNQHAHVAKNAQFVHRPTVSYSMCYVSYSCIATLGAANSATKIRLFSLSFTSACDTWMKSDGCASTQAARKGRP